MNFELLKKNHLKRNILTGVGIMIIISACILTFSLAKYRTTQSIQIAKGTINYMPYDFEMIAMYQENHSGNYDPIDQIPSSGYIINEEKSYCTIDGEKDNEAHFYTDNQGQHVIQSLKTGSKCQLYFDRVGLNVREAILANTSINQATPDFSKTSCTSGCGESTVGLFQSTDNDGTTYYFRGNVENNWVQFAGFYWRIIRINGDGSLRLIYSGADNGKIETSNQSGTTTQTATSPLNASPNYTRSEYVGFMYSLNQQHGNANKSTILTALNTWYENNIATEYRDFLSTSTWFCSDRNMASGYTWSATPSSTIRYAAYGRLVSTKSPSFNCSNSYDRVNTSNGLTYPIGLITADEIAFAGGVYDTANQNYYLYTGQNYWTMTPFHYPFADVIYLSSNGSLSNMSVDNSLGIRPVINIRSDATIFLGNGTITTPYVIS